MVECTRDRYRRGHRTRRSRTASILVGVFLDPVEKSALLFASQARPEEKILRRDSSWAQLAKCHYIINAASDETAVQIRERLKDDQVLIDNSSAFRLDPDIPLIVPEVNGAQLEAMSPVVANPNCTTIILVLALNALKDIGISRVTVSTYQAASGAGIKGLEELDAQLQAVGQGKTPPRPESVSVSASFERFESQHRYS